ncbi:hypothetical protein HMPREF9472_00992 [Enterocloster bolteae WAL-14578]|nr:hypothetical protein HMPREF9472_00992 [Enterocloster bolteae WAL-14578]
MYFITTKRMLEVCFSAHPNIQYRTSFLRFGCPWAGLYRKAAEAVSGRNSIRKNT